MENKVFNFTSKNYTKWYHWILLLFFKCKSRKDGTSIIRYKIAFGKFYLLGVIDLDLTYKINYSEFIGDISKFESEKQYNKRKELAAKQISNHSIDAFSYMIGNCAKNKICLFDISSNTGNKEFITELIKYNKKKIIMNPKVKIINDDLLNESMNIMKGVFGSVDNDIVQSATGRYVDGEQVAEKLNLIDNNMVLIENIIKVREIIANSSIDKESVRMCIALLDEILGNIKKDPVNIPTITSLEQKLIDATIDYIDNYSGKDNKQSRQKYNDIKLLQKTIRMTSSINYTYSTDLAQIDYKLPDGYKIFDPFKDK